MKWNELTKNNSIWCHFSYSVFKVRETQTGFVSIKNYEWRVKNCLGAMHHDSCGLDSNSFATGVVVLLLIATVHHVAALLCLSCYHVTMLLCTYWLLIYSMNNQQQTIKGLGKISFFSFSGFLQLFGFSSEFLSLCVFLSSLIVHCSLLIHYPAIHSLIPSF